MRAHCLRAVLLGVSILAAAQSAVAQEPRSVPAVSRFLFLNQDRILTNSEAGKVLLAEEAAALDRLRAEAREIEQAFEAEERDLTEKRATMDPVEFRALADDFDTRVVQARRVQDERSASVASQFDQRRRQFYADVAPVLVALLERFEAVAIFDESSVLLADQTLNITDAVIAEIDGRGLGAGPPAGEAGSGGEAPDEQGEADR